MFRFVFVDTMDWFGFLRLLDLFFFQSSSGADFAFGFAQTKHFPKMMIQFARIFRFGQVLQLLFFLILEQSTPTFYLIPFPNNPQKLTHIPAIGLKMNPWWFSP